MSNLLLLVFALPVATIIIASILETFFHSPLKVAALIFAIYLIVAFAVFDASFLLYVIIYTILALIAALITRVILNFINDDEGNNCSEISNADDTPGTCNCCNRYCGRYYR